MIDELISVARDLVVGSVRTSNQAALKRAVSTAYYALFHALAKSNADVLTNRSQVDGDWVRVYRAMDHGTSKKALAALAASDNGHPAARVAEAFVNLQELRYKADYDPTASFGSISTATLILQAGDAIASLRSLSREVRLNLAIRLLFKSRP